MTFPDGQLPTKDLIKKWLQVVDDFFTPGSTLSQGVVDEGKGAAAAEAPGDSIEKRGQPTQL